MILKNLAGRSMSKSEILKILRKVAAKYNAELLGSAYRDFDLELIVLIDGSEEAKDGICSDMNAILTGYMNPSTMEIIDCTLEIEDVCCPNTTVTSNAVLYQNLVKCKRGDILC